MNRGRIEANTKGSVDGGVFVCLSVCLYASLSICLISSYVGPT